MPRRLLTAIAAVLVIWGGCFHAVTQAADEDTEPDW